MTVILAAGPFVRLGVLFVVIFGSISMLINFWELLHFLAMDGNENKESR